MIRRSKRFFSFFLIFLLVCSFFFIPQAFATNLLEETWEDGTDNAWTGQSGTPTVGTNDPDTGIYALETEDYPDYEFLDVSSTEIQVQGRIKVKTLPDEWTKGYFVRLSHTGDGRTLLGLALANWGGTYQWYIEYYDGSTQYAISAEQTNPTVNVYQTYKVRCVCGAGTGIYQIWINGNLLTDLNLSSMQTGSSTVTRVEVGTTYDDMSSTVDLAQDNIYIADGEITFSKYPYVQQLSDVDSVADIGTHSNFTAQQYAPDLINDTLTEADAGGGEVTSEAFRDGFENANFDLWTDGGTTTWDDGDGVPSTYIGSPWTVFNGTYYATCDSNDDGSLTTDNIDCSDATSIGVSFWYMNDDLDGSDYAYSYYNGAGYGGGANIGGTNPEDTWHYFSAIITDDQYFVANFRLRLTGAPGPGEVAFLDDVIINKTTVSTNYKLELEEQFTEIPYAEFSYPELHIQTGAFSGAEDLNVQVWNGTWNLLGTLEANTENVFSISSYLDSSDLYIRFVDGTQSSDSTQNTWDIDSAWIEEGEPESENVIVDLPETVAVSASLGSRKSLYRSSTETIVVSSNVYGIKALYRYSSESVATNANLGSNKALYRSGSETTIADDVLGTRKTLTHSNGESTTVTEILSSTKSITAVIVENLESFAVGSGIYVLKALTSILSESGIAEAVLFVQKALTNMLQGSIVSTIIMESSKSITAVMVEGLESFAAYANLLVTKSINGLLQAILGVASDFISVKALTHISEGSTVVSTIFESSKSLTAVMVESLESAVIDGTLFVHKTLTTILSGTITQTAILENAKSLTAVIVQNFESAITSATLLTQKAISTVLQNTIDLTALLSSVKGLTIRIFELPESMAATASLLSQKEIHVITTALLDSVSASLGSLKAILSSLQGTTQITSILESSKGIHAVIVNIIETSQISAVLDTVKHLGALLIEFIENIPIESVLRSAFNVELTGEEMLIVGAILGIFVFGPVVAVLILGIRKARENDDDD